MLLEPRLRDPRRHHVLAALDTLDNWRRLVVRYDWHTDVYIAFLTIACFMTTLSKILG